MKHLQIPFVQLSPEAQFAFLDMVETDRSGTPPFSKSVYIQPPTAFLWYFWGVILIFFAFISTKIVDNSSVEFDGSSIEIHDGQSVQFSRNDHKFYRIEKEPAVPLWISYSLAIVGFGVLLNGTRVHQRLKRPPWPSRLYFTDTLLIDTRGHTLSFIPLSDIKSVTLNKRHSTNSDGMTYYHTQIAFHSNPKLYMYASSGEQSGLDQQREEAVYKKVLTLTENPQTENVFRIGDIQIEVDESDKL